MAIFGVYTVETKRADEVEGMALLINPTNGATALVERNPGVKSGLVTFRNLSGKAPMVMSKGRPVTIVTDIEDWDTMSDDTRMDIELALMVRGAL